MNTNYDIVYESLTAIYEKHRRRYKGNRDTTQMCCMWSTISPPDTIMGTRQLTDIETAFDISIDEDNAMEIYDMELGEAVTKIIEIQEGKS